MWTSGYVMSVMFRNCVNRYSCWMHGCCRIHWVIMILLGECVSMDVAGFWHQYGSYCGKGVNMWCCNSNQWQHRFRMPVWMLQCKHWRHGSVRVKCSKDGCCRWFFRSQHYRTIISLLLLHRSSPHTCVLFSYFSIWNLGYGSWWLYSAKITASIPALRTYWPQRSKPFRSELYFSRSDVLESRRKAEGESVTPPPWQSRCWIIYVHLRNSRLCHLAASCRATAGAALWMWHLDWDPETVGGSGRPGMEWWLAAPPLTHSVTGAPFVWLGGPRLSTLTDFLCRFAEVGAQTHAARHVRPKGTTCVTSEEAEEQRLAGTIQHPEWLWETLVATVWWKDFQHHRCDVVFMWPAFVSRSGRLLF